MLLNLLIWYFFDVPKAILQGWRNFLYFGADYFSLPVLLKTFFSHWRRYYSAYGKKWDPKRFAESFVFNTMSRLIGIALRTFFIIAGLLAEALIIVIGGAVFISWFLVIPVLIIGFLFGLRLIIF